MTGQRTALVLGGGGITGIAWEIGMLAGLADAGIDLTGADLVVGTSAGSVVGAQITCGGELGALVERQFGPPAEERVARLRRSAMAQWAWACLRSRGDDQAFRRRIGALALAAEQAGATPSEEERPTPTSPRGTTGSSSWRRCRAAPARSPASTPRR